MNGNEDSADGSLQVIFHAYENGRIRQNLKNGYCPKNPINRSGQCGGIQRRVRRMSIQHKEASDPLWVIG